MCEVYGEHGKKMTQSKFCQKLLHEYGIKLDQGTLSKLLTGYLPNYHAIGPLVLSTEEMIVKFVAEQGASVGGGNPLRDHLTNQKLVIDIWLPDAHLLPLLAESIQQIRERGVGIRLSFSPSSR